MTIEKDGLIWYEIDPDKWLRGEGPMNSCLYRPKDGKSCCIGLALQAEGVPLERLNGVGEIESHSYFYDYFNEEEHRQAWRCKDRPSLLYVYLANDTLGTSTDEEEEEDMTTISDDERIANINDKLQRLELGFRFYLKGKEPQQTPA